MSDILKELEQEKKISQLEKQVNELKWNLDNSNKDLNMYKSRFGNVNIMEAKSYDITISLDEYRHIIRENERLSQDNIRLNDIVLGMPVEYTKGPVVR